MSLQRFIFSVTAGATITGCCTVDHPCIRNVRREYVPQIAQAVRAVTSAKITRYEHDFGELGNLVFVHTADGKEYQAIYSHGKWKVNEVPHIITLG